MAKKTPVMPMDSETETLLDECEAAWDKKVITIPNVVLDDSPMKDLIVKAYNIIASESYENLDALAVRIADVCPGGITDENFAAAKPVAGACKKWFSNVEKLRKALKRPALDWGQAVDQAAADMAANAEPTLGPLIKQAKAIEDRKKAEKAAAEAAAAQKIIDDRLAEEKAHRDKIEAEQAAERKRLADEKAALEEQAKAMRAEADKLAQERRDAEARNKAANDELADLRKQLEQMGRTEVKAPPEVAKAIVEAQDGKAVTIEQRFKPPIPPLFDDEPAPLPPDPQQTVQEDWEKARDDEHRDQACDSPPTLRSFEDAMLDAETSAEFSKAGVEVDSSADQQKVRDFGNAIKVFMDSLKRPLIVKHEARQAVELAVFDVYGIANGLQEWRWS